MFLLKVIPILLLVQAQHAQLRTYCGAAGRASRSASLGREASMGVTVQGEVQDGHWKQERVHLTTFCQLIHHYISGEKLE